MNFRSLNISENLVLGLEKQAIKNPTPIQTAAIPELLLNKSCYLEAETGTGKTLAYLLPIFGQLNPKILNPQALIVAPTHELCVQIQRQATELALNSGLAVKTALLIGGSSRDRQIEKLKKKPQIIVGSPGRILELIEDRKLKAFELQTIVIDEADKLLVDDQRSFSDITAIIKASKASRQLVFASATSDAASYDQIMKLAPELKMIKAVASQADQSTLNELIDHIYITCEEREKPDLLRGLIHALNPERLLVFVHKNETAELVSLKLEHHNLPVADIHGAYDKLDRKQALDGFRSGKIKILLASDLAARGLDIKMVSHVVNLDIPSDSKAYQHRVGRTGRAGEKGVAISLVSAPQRRLMTRFEKDLGIKISRAFLRKGEVTVEVKD